MNAVDLSIIIVNYNTKCYLKKCLESLFQQACSYAFEVIVIDNASKDGSVAMVQERFPAVHVIANRYNYGFAVANNQGYRMCHGRYIMTLNPDATLLLGAIDEIVTFAILTATVHKQTATDQPPKCSSGGPLGMGHRLRCAEGEPCTGIFV